MTTNRSSVSAGVSTAVGSSRMSSRVSWMSALSTSTRWRSPTDAEVVDDVVGVDLQAEAGAELGDAGLHGGAVEAAGPHQLAAQEDVGGHRQRPDELEVLVHHADPERVGLLRRVDVDRLPSKRISPESGRAVPAIIVISVVLPAPFSPTMACTLPASTDQVDVVVGDLVEPNVLVMSRSSSSGWSIRS